MKLRRWGVLAVVLVMVSACGTRLEQKAMKNGSNSV